MTTRRERLTFGAAIVSLVTLTAIGPPPATARVFLSVDDALNLAFPRCETDRMAVFLTPAQRDRASELAGREIGSRLVHLYTASCGGVEAGTAYFDSHRVRTQPETVMVVVDPRGHVSRIELLSFREPEDYIPRRSWYDQFIGRILGPDLNLKQGIDGVTGATLTTRATADAVRRILAIHGVVRVGLSAPGEGSTAPGSELGPAAIDTSGNSPP